MATILVNRSTEKAKEELQRYPKYNCWLNGDAFEFFFKNENDLRRELDEQLKSGDGRLAWLFKDSFKNDFERAVRSIVDGAISAKKALKNDRFKKLIA